MLNFKRNRLELVFKNKIISVYDDYLSLPNGKDIVYCNVKKASGAGALLVDENNKFVLIKQFRNATDKISIEIPAGGYSSADESGEACALREVEEETGLIPTKLYPVCDLYAMASICNERNYVFIGTDLVNGKINRDPEEFLEIIYVEPDEAVDMIFKGEIFDSKTIIAILAYREMKNRGII